MKISRFGSFASLVSALALVVACDSSTSGGDDNTPEIPKKETYHGNPEFSCVVTQGESWVKMELNIPKYKGMVRKLENRGSGSFYEYYEETYFDLSTWQMKEMCLEYEDAAREKEAEDIQCGNGRFSMGHSFNLRDDYSYDVMGETIIDFTESCQSYEEQWNRGEYSDEGEFEGGDEGGYGGNTSTEGLPEKCEISLKGNVLSAAVVYSNWSMVAYASFEKDKVGEEYDFAGLFGDHAKNVCDLLRDDDENVVCESDRVTGDDIWAESEGRPSPEEAKEFAEYSCQMLMEGRVTLEEFVIDM